MNILYLADPNSIHDVRWINFFAEKNGYRCFVIYRVVHQRNVSEAQSLLHDKVTLLAAIKDCSTVRPWRNWADVLRIKRILLKYNVQVFHILYAEPNALWANWKWFWRVPVVITTRGTDVLKTIPGFFRRSTMLSKIVAKQYAWAFGHADYITGTSSRQIEILKSFGISTGSAVVRTGVDFDAIRSAVFEGTIPDEIMKPFVLMPRHMKPVYHHEFTVDAIALLDRSITEKYSFLFLNSDTEEQAYFHQIRKKAESVNARICFIPSLTHRDLLGLFGHASLVIMNPLSDGSPVTAMEAMACRVPVILSPGHYDREVFGSTFTFDEWSPESLKNKITEVLTMSPKDLEGYTTMNYSLVMKGGNSEIELNKVCKIYEALL